MSVCGIFTGTSQVYNTWRKEKDSHYCKYFVNVCYHFEYQSLMRLFLLTGDKNLLQSLVFDALVTDSLEKLSNQVAKADKQ